MWGQFTVSKTHKGFAARGAGAEAKNGLMMMVDTLAPTQGQESVVVSAPGPQRVNILDHDLGIFRLDWIGDPYGLYKDYLPCLMEVGSGSSFRNSTTSTDLGEQDKRPIALAARVADGTWARMKSSLDLKVLLTMVPAVPNTKKQFHVIEIDPEELAKKFRTTVPIGEGTGPDLEIFVPPSEMTARLAWEKDTEALETLQELLGLKKPSEEEEEAGEINLDGFVVVNAGESGQANEAEGRHLQGYAESIAAERLVALADTPEGAVASVAPDTPEAFGLKGNITSTSITVDGGGSGAVSAMQDHRGKPPPVPRFATMPDATRQIVLRLVVPD